MVERTVVQRKNGFTLIELMMVAAIIGVLASIALPKFGNMIIKTKEAKIKGQLGALRSAISIYYADNEGFFPCSPWHDALDEALAVGGRYIDEVPEIEIPTVRDRNHRGKLQAVDTYVSDESFTLFGKSWAYMGVLSENHGRLSVNCTHLDSSGRPWSTY